MINKIHLNEHIRSWIVSCFIILLLYPGFQRLGHLHHRHHIVLLGDPLGLNDHEEHCELCSFQFPNFLRNKDVIHSEIKRYIFFRFFSLESSITSCFSGYHFLLRGPPLSNLSTLHLMQNK